MAAYNILGRQGNYISLEVLVGDAVFPQLIISSKLDEELDSALQHYADTYEAELNNSELTGQ